MTTDSLFNQHHFPSMSGHARPLRAGWIQRHWTMRDFAVHCNVSALQTLTGKTSTLTFRLEPMLKEALCIAADRDHRSIASMVEVMIRGYCGRNSFTMD